MYTELRDGAERILGGGRFALAQLLKQTRKMAKTLVRQLAAQRGGLAKQALLLIAQAVVRYLDQCGLGARGCVWAFSAQARVRVIMTSGSRLSCP